jgi:hypothetical protein
LVQAYWKSKQIGAGICDFEAFWRKSLHDGWIEGTTSRRNKSARKRAAFRRATNINPDGFGYEINIRRDASVYDGRFSNNGWLQELPRR